MPGNLLYDSATGHLLHDAATGHLLYQDPYGPSYSVGVAKWYQKRGLGANWSISYANFLAAGWSSSSTANNLRSYNSATNVNMLAWRCNTSSNNGLLYSEVDLNVLTYTPGSSTIYLSVISNSSQNPTTSLATIRAASKAQITGTGSQTFVLDSAFTMAAYTKLFVWELTYQDPTPSVWQTQVDKNTNPVFHN